MNHCFSRVFMIACALLLFSAVSAVGRPINEPPSRQTTELEFGVRIVAPQKIQDMPVVILFSPLKPGSFDPPKTVEDFAFVFNLDIYGKKERDRVHLTKEITQLSRDEPITVYFSSSQDKSASAFADRLYFWQPKPDGSGEWVKISNLFDKYITKIDIDRETGHFFFQVWDWPPDDRMIAYGR